MIKPVFRNLYIIVFLYALVFSQGFLWASPLAVDYVHQFNANACGAAALEMVYRYYGLADITQQEIFNKYQEIEPEFKVEKRISTGSLVADAKSRGFRAFWKRVNLQNEDETIDTLKAYLNNAVPIIVCQQFSKQHPQIGHFRVVVDIDEDNNVYFYDPDKGKDLVKWSIDKFMDYWQPTGQNVTGGVYIIIEKTDV